jgi:transcriptional regulator with XRE-family HTH domain
MAIGKRLKIVRDCDGLTREAMASKLGVHKNTLGSYETGKSLPDSGVLNRLLDMHPELNPIWLLTGEGEMKRNDSPVSAPDPAPTDPQTACTALDDETAELVTLLKRYGNKALVEEMKKRLLKIKLATETE